MGGDDGLEEDAFFSCVERWLSMKKQGEETSDVSTRVGAWRW
jgi:hypothetical protein